MCNFWRNEGHFYAEAQSQTLILAMFLSRLSKRLVSEHDFADASARAMPALLHASAERQLLSRGRVTGRFNDEPVIDR